jgi:site-specific recombinase XerD
MEERALSEPLREYELVFMPSRNWAAKTRVNYRNDIAELSRFLEKEGKTDPIRVDLQDLEAYMAELDRRGYTGTTRRKKTSSIKSFSGFLKRYRYVISMVIPYFIPSLDRPKVQEVVCTIDKNPLASARALCCNPGLKLPHFCLK